MLLFCSFLCRLFEVEAQEIPPTKSNQNDNTKPKGIAKSRADLYKRTPESPAYWECLDGSAKIPWEAINDDFCDCTDGSDEPGTSACLNSRFFCQNRGHIPAYIEASRVNDGICESECCDGSDEFDGQVSCPNTCKQLGIQHRQRLKELERLQTKGGEIKKDYIEFGRQKRFEWQADLERLLIELTAAKQRVQERKEVLEKAEEKDRILRQDTKKERENRSRALKQRITKLTQQSQKYRDQIDTLLKILRDLKQDHNQNYHDMAVKTAISGYDEFLKEFEEEKGSRQDESDDEEKGDEDQDDENDDDEEEKDTINDAEIKAKQLQGSLPTADESSYWDIISDAIKSTLNGFLETFGLDNIIKFSLSSEQYQKTDDSFKYGQSKEVNKAREAHKSAETEQRDMEKRIDEINGKLERDFGRQNEWIKLDGQCFDYLSGDYTYTLCLFDKGTQKSAQDYSGTNLGSFSRWTGADSSDHPEYYLSQIYENGQRCWNGPERSLKVIFECGLENKITSVTEPEKCEYMMKMNTPAVCPDSPFDKKSKNTNAEHQEL
ncbi:hypothetical protein G9A89_010592 [Geosiphon pyriformis]|nr:hypothetical protein G9A89_010592 [Geosiphon pyriformis]